MKINKKQQWNGRKPNIGRETYIETLTPIQLDEMVEEFLIRTRRILIVGEIDETMSAHVCSYLQFLATESQPVYIYIHSHGGCFASGYAIIDQMLTCGCPIYTIVRGHGYSMGAIIAAFGTNGHRYATPNSSLMLHSISIQNVSEPIEQHKKMTTYLLNDYRTKLVSLSKRLKITMKQLIKLMDETAWISPKQAIKIGLIDGIWTPSLERSIVQELNK